MSAALTAGTVWVNCFFVRDLGAPFGGSGHSGIGREGGVHSFDFYSDIKNTRLRARPVGRRRTRLIPMGEIPMGEVVGAGLIAHVPTIMLPEETRRELNHGEDTTLVSGLSNCEARSSTPWTTTRSSCSTHTGRRPSSTWSRRTIGALAFSPPRSFRAACHNGPYDFSGDPELAHAIAAQADKHGTWITAIDDPELPIFYATTNLWEYLGQGLANKRWVSIGVCQTAETEDNLRLGRALGDAITETDRKVVLIACGALSHTFWSLRELRKHEAAGVEHIYTPEAAAADFERIDWFKNGDHARVLETMPDFYRFRPEARFGHYLMMMGALGEGDCTATARQYGDYENSIGTGQVHLWFDRPADGFPRPHASPLMLSSSARRVAPTSLLQAERMTEFRRILLDGATVEVVRHGDELVAGDGRAVACRGRDPPGPCRANEDRRASTSTTSAGSRSSAPSCPPAPTYFHKPTSALNAHKGAVVRPERRAMAQLRGRDRHRHRQTCRNVSPGRCRRLHRAVTRSPTTTGCTTSATPTPGRCCGSRARTRCVR